LVLMMTSCGKWPPGDLRNWWRHSRRWDFSEAARRTRGDW
jgi:hypothetical protein